MNRQTTTTDSAALASRVAYSPTELAHMLGLSRETIDREIRDGQIRHRRIRGRVLIPASELRRILGETA